MLSLVRVDNRLIHGQVVEAWLPHVRAERVIVADDEAATSTLIRAAMGLAVGDQAEVLIRPLEGVETEPRTQDARRTLLLFRDVAGVFGAHAHGLPLERLNVGNVHFSTGRRSITSSVYLSLGELEQLGALARAGVEVSVQSVPSEKPVAFPEMVERFHKGL